MDEPYEDDPDYDDWFNPFPMVVYAKHKPAIVSNKAVIKRAKGKNGIIRRTA